MPIVLYRIDERLLHGQVVVGWGRRLGIRFYVVIDDQIAESTWEQELYGSAVPEGAEAFFLAFAEALDRLAELDARPDLGMALTAGTSTMRRLGEAGLLAEKEVNVGGLHAAPGRERVLDYVFLSRDETEDLRVLAELAGSLSARDLPGSKGVSGRTLLRTRERAGR
ncbi:MAG: PTS sugar transporter subunit IIB [Gemmatimonadota bacterium]|jgi:PTS system mannose-specific IIB component/fructoselysine and glucoselysine-specific PTS system IIB component|nr:MAG: PTS sugar transporter subunit IIB [Gemmatimonadota bacterium]